MMRFRISHKIAAIGLIGFGGLALVGGIYLAGDAAQETYRVVAADARVISDQVDRLARDLLESRRAEKDFLLRSDEKYAQRHTELAKSVRRASMRWPARQALRRSPIWRRTSRRSAPAIRPISGTSAPSSPPS